jgi:hypothetical protein
MPVKYIGIFLNQLRKDLGIRASGAVKTSPFNIYPKALSLLDILSLISDTPAVLYRV